LVYPSYSLLMWCIKNEMAGRIWCCAGYRYKFIS
jgi:hypothetical protein